MELNFCASASTYQAGRLLSGGSVSASAPPFIPSFSSSSQKSSVSSAVSNPPCCWLRARPPCFSLPSCLRLPSPWMLSARFSSSDVVPRSSSSANSARVAVGSSSSPCCCSSSCCCKPPLAGAAPMGRLRFREAAESSAAPSSSLRRACCCASSWNKSGLCTARARNPIICTCLCSACRSRSSMARMPARVLCCSCRSFTTSASRMLLSRLSRSISPSSPPNRPTSRHDPCDCDAWRYGGGGAGLRRLISRRRCLWPLRNPSFANSQLSGSIFLKPLAVYCLVVSGDQRSESSLSLGQTSSLFLSRRL
uniref:Uncharacterized protein n=1 Tax=Zea mays TaxID=4577 RepID=C0P419_MAIZE|nr:unknown [Zea mays]ACR38752.1 unknown [Zea mays]